MRRRGLALGTVGVALTLAVSVARRPEAVPLPTLALLILLLLAALALQAPLMARTRTGLAVVALLAPALLIAWVAGLGAAAVTPSCAGVAGWWSEVTAGPVDPAAAAPDPESPIAIPPRHTDLNENPNADPSRSDAVAYLRLSRPEPTTGIPRQVYLRDQVFTTFDGLRWDSPHMPPQWLRDGDDGTTDGVIRLTSGGGEPHQIYLTEHAPPYLLTMPEAHSVGLARLIHMGQAAYRLPTREGHRVSYMAVSTPLTWAELPPGAIAAGTAAAAHLQIPENATGQRIARAAHVVSRSAPDTRAQIDLLLAYMAANYTYTRATNPPSADPVGDFFFDRRAGHCQYYASSFILMLRALGIPARLAVGYGGANPDPETGIYVYTGYHRHAWPEVHLAGYGWVIVDPTPTAARDAEIDQASRAALADFAPADYTVLGQPLGEAGDVVAPVAADSTSRILATGLIAAAIGLLAAAWSRRRRDAIQTLAPHHVQPDPAYLQALSRHFAAVLPRSPGTTLAEYLALLSAAGHLSADLSDLRAYHYAVHYEGLAPDPARERAFIARIRALPAVNASVSLSVQ